MIQLIPKEEINVRKATERRRELSEGMKLAKTVDRLRETRADEEASLQKFRRETLSVITEEISRETAKKDTLERENKELEQKRRELKEPLDRAWDEVNQHHANLQATDNMLSVLEKNLETREKTLDMRDKNLKDKEKLTSQRYTRATQLAQEGDIMRSNSVRKLRESESRETALSKRIASQEEWKAQKEQSFGAREEKLRVKEAELTAKETDLRVREKELVDKYKALAQTAERIQKHGTSK